MHVQFANACKPYHQHHERPKITNGCLLTEGLAEASLNIAMISDRPQSSAYYLEDTALQLLSLVHGHHA